MEGHLSCLKFIIGESHSISQVLGARNNNGETPKMLAERFYKNDVFEYISNIEWERDHPEEAESMLFSNSCYTEIMPKLFKHYTLCSEKKHPLVFSSIFSRKIFRLLRKFQGMFGRY